MYKKVIGWIAVAVAFAIGYGLGAREPLVRAQFDNSFMILSELQQIASSVQSIESSVSSIEQCVGQSSFRSFGCEIEVEVQR